MPIHLPYEEKELLLRIAAGDNEAFTQLVDTYGSLVFHYIRQHARSREVAEEIVQDIFTQVWLVRETLTEVRNFKTFLYVICRNYALNVLKKLTREKKRLLEYEQELEHAATETDPDNDDDWRIGLIQRAINELPPQQQKVWTLSRHEGLKHAEIAQQMDLSKESVKKYIQWANAFIVKYVEDHMAILVALILLEKS